MNAIDRGLSQGTPETGRDMGTSRVAPGVESVVLSGPANVVALAPLAATPATFAFAAGFGDGSVLLYEGALSAESPVPTPATRPLISHKGAVTSLAVVEGTLVSAGQDGAVRSFQGLVTAPGGWVEHLTAAPNGSCFAAVSGRKVITGTLDGQTGELDDHPSSVSGLAFSPDGRQLAASHYNGVTLWATGSGTKIRTLTFKGSHIGVGWSPDGRFIVSTTQERELHVWDLVTDKDFRLGGYATKVRSLAWMAEPMHLACSGADAITAWPFGDVGPGVLPPKEIGFAHKATVARVAVDPTRPQVAGGYTDGTVFVGGVRKGEAAFVRLPDGEPVTALAYTPEGLLLAANRSGKITVISVAGEVN